MEIGSKSIRGVYLYDPSINFNIGDFVIYGSSIYVVKNDVVGIEPITEEGKDYYETYLANEIAEEGDFEDYANGTGNDKFVTARTLAKVLNKYMSGFSDKGLIENKVADNGQIYLSDFFGNQTLSDITNSYVSPLDKLMVHPSLNNGIFIVSGAVCKDIFGDYEDEDLILRQYTYKNDKGINVRIQELNRISAPSSRFRYATSDNSYEPLVPWETTSINLETADEVNKLIEYYSSCVNDLITTKLKLVDNFRYKKADLRELISNQSWRTEYKGSLITICTKELESSGVYRTHSATVDLTGVNETGIKIRVVNNKVLTVSVQEGYVNFLCTDNSDGNFSIDTVYFRQTYGDQLSNEGSSAELWKGISMENNVGLTNQGFFMTPKDLGVNSSTFNDACLEKQISIGTYYYRRYRTGDLRSMYKREIYYTFRLSELSLNFDDSDNDNTNKVRYLETVLRYSEDSEVTLWIRVSVENSGKVKIDIPIVNSMTLDALPLSPPGSPVVIKYNLTSARYKDEI